MESQLYTITIRKDSWKEDLKENHLDNKKVSAPYGNRSHDFQHKWTHKTFAELNHNFCTIILKYQ